MKKTKIAYWIITSLFAAFMLFSASGNVIADKASVEFLHNYLGYPIYFIPFIGIAKVLGSIAIVVPGYPRIKEWAYAGLAFDLVGATYSVSVVSKTVSGGAFMLLLLAFLAASYILYHKLRKAQKETAYNDVQLASQI